MNNLLSNLGIHIQMTMNLAQRTVKKLQNFFVGSLVYKILFLKQIPSNYNSIISSAKQGYEQFFFEFRNPHSNECENSAKEGKKVEKLFLRKTHLQDTASEVNPNRIHFQDTVAEVNPSRLRFQDTLLLSNFITTHQSGMKQTVEKLHSNST